MTEFSLKAALDAYRPTEPSEQDAKRRMLELLHDHPELAFTRDWMKPGHFTASGWLLNTDGSKALLTHHAFLDQWLQLGGHVDGNPDVLAGALREAREESGLGDIRAVTPDIFDIDIHPIPDNPARNEGPHLHYDVRFLLQTGQDAFIVSDESRSLGWFTADDMAGMELDTSVRRMIGKWQENGSTGRQTS